MAAKCLGELRGLVVSDALRDIPHGVVSDWSIWAAFRIRTRAR